MAKTYTLTSTSVNGGQGTISYDFSGFSTDSTVSSGGRYGYYNSRYRATSILFNASTLATLRTKTVTSIKLTLTYTIDTSIPSSGTTQFPIGYKLNSSTTDWTRSNADSTASSTTVAAGYVRTTGDRQIIEAGTSFTFDLSSGKVPKYGYVIGYTGSATSAYHVIGATATLVVVTTETDKTYTLSYNANGGSGAPSSSSKTTSTGSASFTVSKTVPTKTGSTFLGWATNSSAEEASYVGGDPITITANTTLYAVWELDTYTVSYNKGSYGEGTNTTDTKTYNVPLTLKNAIFTRSGYVQDGWATSDGGSAVYSLGGSYTANSAITLYPSWKATTSVISANNGTLGTQMTLGITRYNSDYTHTILFQFGTVTGTIGTWIATSVDWTPPISMASEFTASESGTCLLTCITYDADLNELGRSTTSITLSIPSSVKVTVSSVALAETVAGIDAQFSAFVQNKSRVSVTGTTDSSDAYGATIASYSIVINGQTLTANGAVTGLLQTSGTNSYTFTVKDSRGRTDSYPFTVKDGRGRTDSDTGTFNVVAYTAPSITATAQRDSATPTTINISYTYAVSAVGGSNTKQIVIKYRVFGGSTWTTATTITPALWSGNGVYSITGTSSDTSYEVNVEVTDYFGSISTTSSISAIGNRIYHISHTDQTIGRHGDSKNDGWDHQYFPEVYHDALTVEGAMTYPGKVVSVNGNAADAQGNVTVPIPTVPVESVNGQTGEVVLDADDVDALDKTNGGAVAGDVTFGGAINTSPSGISNPPLTGNLAHTGDYIESNPSNVNVSTTTWTTVASITLTEGKWLLWYTARFNDSTYNSGRRMSIITTSDSSTTSHAVMLEDNIAPVPDQSTYCKAMDVLEKASTSTYYLRVWHNAGATIGVTARLHAIRIC